MINFRNSGWLFFWVCSTVSFAQSKYWIFLKDKNPHDAPAVSRQTIENREKQGLVRFDESDSPVQASYLQSLQNQNIKVVQKSKWLNAVSAHLTQEQILAVKRLPFVTKIQPINGQFYISLSAPQESALPKSAALRLHRYMGPCFHCKCSSFFICNHYSVFSVQPLCAL